MRATVRFLGVAAALAAMPGLAHAIEYRSVSQPAIMFDAPSDKGKRLFIVAAATPVEVIVTLDKWVKVRDAGGALTWLERRVLSDKRTVMITAPRAVVRQSAADDAPAAFETVKDVVLDLVSQSGNGWVQVRHRDGSSGYLKVGEVWGL
jgi:SH3-like domain-containing protein